MYPAPRNAIRRGSWSSSRKAVLVSRYSSPGMPRCRGLAPAATTKCRAYLAVYRQPLRTHEPGGPVIGRDPSFLEPLLPIGWHGISEGPFELHQFGPGYMRVALTPLACIRRWQAARFA